MYEDPEWRKGGGGLFTYLRRDLERPEVDRTGWFGVHFPLPGLAERVYRDHATFPYHARSENQWVPSN